MKEKITRTGNSSLKMFFLTLLTLFTFQIQAQQLMNWNASGVSNFGPSPWSPENINANLTTSGLVRGSAIGTGGTGAGSAWGGAGGWSGSTGATSDNNSFHFTVVAQAGYQVSFSSITTRTRRSNSGPTGYTLYYSVGGAAFQSAGSVTTSSTSGTTGTANSITLSNIPALQDVAPGTVVKFRINPTDGGAQGTYYVTNGANALVVNGTVENAALPVPVATDATTITTAGFTANWDAVAGATAYYLDVSTNPAFTDILSAYNNLVVYGFSQYVSEGVQPGVAYYYRVRAASDTQLSENSNIIQAVLPACGTIDVPVVAATQVLCGPSTVGQLQATGTGSIMWYDLQVGGSPLAPEQAINNSGFYYVSQVINNCESERVAVIVTINPVPEMPQTIYEQTFCGEGTVAELQTVTGTNLKWYITESDVAPLSPETPLVTGNYYVSQTVNGCESPLAITEVTIFPIPDAPTAPAQTICSFATVADLTVTNGEMPLWYENETGGTAIEGDANFTTGTYYVSQTVNGCESPRTAVAITVTPAADGPVVAAQLFCNSGTVADLVAETETAMWYAAEVGGDVLADDTDLMTGTYYVSQMVDGCESARTAVAVTVNPTPAAPQVPASQTFCNAATVADLEGEGELVWYETATGGTALDSAMPLTEGLDLLYAAQVVGGCESTARTAVAIELNITDAPAAAAQLFCGSAMADDIEVTGVNVNIYDAATGGNALAMDAEITTGTYYVSQTIDGCESPRTAVEITVNPVPTAPVVEAQQFCGSAIATDLPILPGYIWYTAATGENYLPVDAQLITGTYYVSQMGMGCESDRTAVSVTVNPTPEAPMMEAQLFCGSAVASDLSWDNGYMWYTDAEGSNMLATDAALATGTYYVSQTVNGCESATTAVTVTVNPVPAAPVVEAQSFCGSAVASDLSWDNGYMWYTDAEGTNMLATDAALATGTYYVSQTVSGCESATTAVSVTVNPTPDAPEVADQTFCGSATAADLPVGEGYTWYTDAEGTTALATDAALTTGIYYVSQTTGGCESALAEIGVIITLIETPVGEATQEYEAGQTLADLDVTGLNLMWYADEDMTEMLESTTALEDGTTYYAVSVNGECTSEALAVTVSETSSATKFDKAQLTYYPNPVSDVLNISYKGGIDSIEIYNLLGQQVLIQSVNTREAAINMSALAQGSYVVKIVSGNTAATVKVLKK